MQLRDYVDFLWRLNGFYIVRKRFPPWWDLFFRFIKTWCDSRNVILINYVAWPGMSGLFFWTSKKKWSNKRKVDIPIVFNHWTIGRSYWLCITTMQTWRLYIMRKPFIIFSTQSGQVISRLINVARHEEKKYKKSKADDPITWINLQSVNSKY